MEKEILYTPITNRALFSKDIKTKDKFVLIKLKQMSKNNISKIKINQLKDKCYMSDNRTIVQSLSRLKEFNFINYEEFKSIPKLQIEITLIQTEEDSIYTKIDNEMIDKICELFPNPYNPLILYYILESRYNVEYGYSCPNREELSEYITISNNRLTEIVLIMHENYICEYCQGIFVTLTNGMTDYDYSSRLRNRYIPNTIAYKQSEDNIGKRRYSKHKPKDYFFKELK